MTSSRANKLILFIFILAACWPSYTLAAITSLSLNGANDNATINPTITDKIDIHIVSDVPVKFNTIAICAVADAVCNRATAVKYFMHNEFSLEVTKSWDGKRGGAGGAAPDGEYKIKVTTALEGSTTTVAEEIDAPHIIVDSSYAGNIPAEEEDEDDDVSNDEDSADNDSSLSAHQSPTQTAKTKTSPVATLSAGRARLSLTNTPVVFAVNTPAVEEKTNYRWSFGDGTSTRGERATHVYRHPGDYVVLLTAKTAETETVARTTVKVVKPDFTTNVDGDTGVISIKNNTTYEVNLGGWAILQGSKKYRLAEDTILMSGQSLKLDQGQLGFSPHNSLAVVMVAPDGEIIHSVESMATTEEDLPDKHLVTSNIETSIKQLASVDNSLAGNIYDKKDSEVKLKESESVVVIKGRIPWYVKLARLPASGWRALGQLFN